MYMQSNEPYQTKETNTTIGSGVVWGGAAGGITGSLTTGAMHYFKNGDLKSMAKISPRVAIASNAYRINSERLKNAPDRAGTKAEKMVSRFAYNSLFNTTHAGHTKRVGASVLLGGVAGMIHNASNGVVF